MPGDVEHRSSAAVRAAPTRRAVREDPRGGVRDEVEFFGPRASQTFGCLHVPLRRLLGGAVICPPLGIEHNRNYRNEVLLSRGLAALGVAAARFHYRGTGNSEGDETAVTFETMRDDAVAAAERLMERTGVSRVAFVGARWGGLIAAAAAARFPTAPVALWEPISEPARYFREIFRLQRIGGPPTGGEPHDSAPSPSEELRRRGSLDVFGHPIHRPLYESSTPRSLGAVLGQEPRPVLLIQIGRRDELRGEYAELTRQWEARGFDVQARVVIGEKPWWFPGMRLEADVVVTVRTALVEHTERWVLERLSPEGGRR